MSLETQKDDSGLSFEIRFASETQIDIGNKENSMADKKTASGGIGLLGFLALIFITLKLMNYINWSWWWVLAPLWIQFVLVIIVLVVTGGVTILTHKKKR